MSLLFSLCISFSSYAYGPGDVYKTDDSLIATGEASIQDNLDNYGIVPVHSRYYYNQLPEYRQQAYNKIYQAILHGDEGVSIGGNLTKEDLHYVWIALYNDNPDIYNPIQNRITYHETNGKPSDITYYTGISEDISAKYQQVHSLGEEAVKGILNDCSQDLSQRNIIKHIYDYVVQNMEYDINDFTQDISGALLNKKGVCVGYAKEFQYLCNLAGIDCTLVTGFIKVDGVMELHAWNLVYLNDGTYFYTDPTFGDAYANGTVWYKYLESASLFETHVISDNTFSVGGITAETPVLFTYPS